MTNRSYWLNTTPTTAYPPLDQPLDVDVAVIGGGIAGVCTAWMLSRTGRRVAILESQRIAESSTGNTTAKVTALHSAIYADLGSERAALYGRSQANALRLLASAAEQFPCDWESRDAYTYALDDHSAQSLHKEAAAAAAASLPAEFVTDVPLPYPVAGAVRVTGQAQFHPRKFLLAVAEDVLRNGGVIVENSRVVKVDDGRVELDDGNPVLADDVVVTTGFPAFDRPELFARLIPKRELVVAAAIPVDAAPDGIFLGIDDGRSVRSTPLTGDDGSADPGRRLLIITGETYEPGAGDVEDRFTALEVWMRERFPTGGEHYRWSAQDYTSSDRIPFVGRYPGRDRVWVATGFGAWGMTNAMMAADLLTARISDTPEPEWSELYDPRRLRIAEVPMIAKAAATAVKNLVCQRITGPATTLEDLRPGHGGVVSIEGQRCAAFRDNDGELHTVSASCTHLGCIVGFNDADRTWECPCHGSRFDVDGAVLQGPALTPLPAIDQPKESS
jgi:glycine/D-amino acid oxidase-like deaminating enzyme/nitrite reductase/ring-hydroxylating ferredoxin subunit